MLKFYLTNILFGLHTAVPLINNYYSLFAVILAFNLCSLLNLMYLTYFKRSRFFGFIIYMLVVFLTIVINNKSVTNELQNLFYFYHYIYYIVFAIESVAQLYLSRILYSNNSYEIKKSLNL